MIDPTKPKSSIAQLPDALEDLPLSEASASSEELSHASSPISPETTQTSVDNSEESQEEIDAENTTENPEEIEENYVSEEALKRALFNIEKKLQNIDTSKTRKKSLTAPPLAFILHETMADQLGISRGEMLLLALVTFYKNVFIPSRKSISELGFLLDNITLQNQELCTELSALEDLAHHAIELESSPSFSPDGTF